MTPDAAKQQWTVEENEAGQRLDQAVSARVSAFSRTRIQKLIQAGDVTLNGEPSSASQTVHAGDEISLIEPPPQAIAPQAQDIPLTVVYEDDDLLVVDKAAGMAVHPGKGISEGTLVNALLGRPHSVSTIGGYLRPGIVHRLDKDTTGLMIVAKNDAAHLAISEALAARKVSRRYLALAVRKFDTDRGMVEAPIARDTANRLKMAVREGHDAKEARTHWRVLERFGGISQIECKLDSGRTHQIRVHMAHIGHPILGDPLYGGSAALAVQVISPYDTHLRATIKGIERQMLHAHDLRFIHPKSGEELHFKADPPKDYQQILERLREPETA